MTSVKISYYRKLDCDLPNGTKASDGLNSNVSQRLFFQTRKSVQFVTLAKNHITSKAKRKSVHCSCFPCIRS